MRRWLTFACLSALLGVGVAVAQDQPQQAAPTAAPTAAPAPARDPADEARRAEVYATVGSTRITVGDIEDAINAQSPFLRARYRDPEKLREFASNMVRFELLANEAQRRGFGQNPAVVRSTKQNAVQQLIRTEFDERITPQSIPETDVQSYFESHQEEFTRPEMVRASHILVATEERARELITELSAADARAFRTAAREHSLDTETKLRGGDLRYFAREGQPPGSRDEPVAEELVTASFGIENVGDIAPEPVQVGERWSIVKLTGRRPAEARTLQQAGQGIRLRLWRERRQEAIEQFVTGLRQRTAPEIFTERMEPIRLDPVDPTATIPGHGHGEEGENGEQEGAEAPAQPADPTAPPEVEGL